MSSAASSSSARRVKVPSGRARDANMEFRVVRSETRPTGDQIELVRPIAHDTLTTEAIVRKLAQEYGYKTQTLTATKLQHLFSFSHFSLLSYFIILMQTTCTQPIECVQK